MLGSQTRIGLGFAALAAWAAIAVPARAADLYDLDPDHTEVRFTYDHLGITRQGGRFEEVTGTLEFDPQAPQVSRVKVVMPLKSLSTGVAKLDELLLKSREYFDPETHPDVQFESTSVRPLSDRTANVAGNLSFNGVTRPVVLEVVWTFSGENPLSAINPTFSGQYISGFRASTQIRRSDWGLTRALPYVSDEVRINIETEAIRRYAPPQEDISAGSSAPESQAVVREAPPLAATPEQAAGPAAAASPFVAGTAAGDGPAPSQVTSEPLPDLAGEGAAEAVSPVSESQDPAAPAAAPAVP